MGLKLSITLKSLDLLAISSQPLKDINLGSRPSVNRKLLTHILTNVPTHRHPSWTITISSAYG